MTKRWGPNCTSDLTKSKRAAAKQERHSSALQIREDIGYGAAQSRVETLERALVYLAGCCLNELAAKDLPLEWSSLSGLGHAQRVLGCETHEELVALVMASDPLPALFTGGA